MHYGNWKKREYSISINQSCRNIRSSTLITLVSPDDLDDVEVILEQI